MPTPSEGMAGGAAATGAAGQAAQEEALARSVLYAALATGLRRPDADSFERLSAPAARRTLFLAADALEAAGGILSRALCRVATTLPLAALRERYDALFGHTARGPVCAFETEYGADNAFRQPQELAHIAGYYQAFGLRPKRVGERVDHIACQSEFMALLAGREACLLEPVGETEEAAGAREEQLQTTRRAAREFLSGHLGRFGLAFGARLAREDQDGFFGGLAGLLTALLRCDAGRLGVALGPPTLDLRSPAVDAVPMACRSCPELLSPDRTGRGQR